MKKIFCLFAILQAFALDASAQVWNVTDVAPLPEPITNNAVVEGYIGDTAYVYTFGGLDSTKVFSGIHLRSYRYAVEGDRWERIADLPDTLGKVAAGASRVGNILYIIGGYHVFANGSERSSNRVHRYDVRANAFLSDGAPIPVPIDDHVQAVWRDSLIFVVTGWSDVGNVPNVQIYDPAADTWQMGVQVPSNHTYMSFGTSGAIVGDTIYYFGGAASSSGFPIQNALRKGVIDPQDPTQITWSTTVFANMINGYRMAATRVYDFVHWLGGSNITYNYNGIAYNGSGGVPPARQNLFLDTRSGGWNILSNNQLPMDLRGIAEVGPETRYLVGGMEDGQQVSPNTLLLEYINVSGNALSERLEYIQEPLLFPNPATDEVYIDIGKSPISRMKVEVFNLNGKKVMEQMMEFAAPQPLAVGQLANGIYFIKIYGNQRQWLGKFIRSH